ncbi:uncharacterized protein LOC112562362 isoform X2 [Pomacea canaliculata]|uniref:uncharacterized protein LOC112562362 isoform X2 n=1 Tax=Pomacea canaliculata TaxID=400727 RepID=UPI000D725DCB|nr:uncharacterized protein LOC112562362 isoform X2 [Pomacea canaliculata]
MADVQLMIQVAFVCMCLGFLFHLIAFTAPHWRRSYNVTASNASANISYGIWRQCLLPRFRLQRGTSDEDRCGPFPLTGYTRATQFFETVGLIAAIASIVLLLLGVCVATCRDRRILPILSGICSIAAAGCILLGTVIFGANDAEEDHLSWAFALCIVGGIFFGVAGVLIIVASVVLKR